jgi:hypothetical protein
VLYNLASHIGQIAFDLAIPVERFEPGKAEHFQFAIRTSVPCLLQQPCDAIRPLKCFPVLDLDE